MPIELDLPATADNFDERSYLEANPDVRDAVRHGRFSSGRHHFEVHGHKEDRTLRRGVEHIEAAQRNKIERITPLLNLAMPHVRRGLKYDFLTPQLRREAGIVETDAISSNGYGRTAQGLIDDLKGGLVLDCGAGRRPIYYENVVNYEIANYDTTDVIGIGENLPFKDCSFDGVISVAVLEHVRNPFKCASEITRVLKPGGRLMCCVPFLQPLHGYPRHYYNMTHQGLSALFDHSLVIDDQQVDESVSPIWSLTWIIKAWADGLTGKAKQAFLSTSLAELLQDPRAFLNEPWVRELSRERNFEIASATILLAHKPS